MYTREVEEHRKLEEDRYSFQDNTEDIFDEKPMKMKMKMVMLVKVKLT